MWVHAWGYACVWMWSTLIQIWHFDLQKRWIRFWSHCVSVVFSPFVLYIHNIAHLHIPTYICACMHGCMIPHSTRESRPADCVYIHTYAWVKSVCVCTFLNLPKIIQNLENCQLQNGCYSIMYGLIICPWFEMNYVPLLESTWLLCNKYTHTHSYAYTPTHTHTHTHIHTHTHTYIHTSTLPHIIIYKSVFTALV